MSILIILIAAWGAGAAGLYRLSFADPLERFTMRILAGLVPVAAVALAAGSYRLAWAQYLLGAWAVAVVITRLRRPGPAGEPGWRFGDLGTLERAALAAILGAWLLALVSALAPVSHWEAAAAHLALPADYAREGRIFPHPGHANGGHPHFLYAHYAAAGFDGAGGRAILVSLLNWAMGCLGCLALYSLGRRAGTRQTGLVAAAILATAPIFLDQAGAPGIDLPFAAFSTGALAAYAAWRDERRWTWLALAGVLAGATCGIRHTGYLVCLLLAAGVVLASPRAFAVRALACFGGAALIAAAPWLLRTGVVAGNPVFPLFASWFPEAPIDHAAVTAPGGRGLLDFLRFPWDIIMRPHLFGGWRQSPGGLVLILGIPGLVLGGMRAWSLGAFSATGGAVLYFVQPLARGLLPFFTPLMVVAALAAENLPRGRRAVAGLLVFAFIYGLGLHAAAVHDKLPVVLGLETKAAYLEARVARYPAFVRANELLQDGGALLTPDPRSYYIDGPTFQNRASLQKIAGWPLDEQVAWLRDHDIRYVMIPVEYVAESGAVSDEIAAMLAEWRRHPALFEPLDPPLILPRPRGGVETVAFYAVR